MNGHWAIRLSLDHLYRACELRLLPGIEAAVDGQVIWLRGDGLDASLQRTLAPVADDAVFHLADDGRLTPFGRSVPVQRLPELKWQRLADLLQPVLPVSKLAVGRILRTRLALRRSAVGINKEGILRTDWESFRDWALATPEIRLKACRFAVCRLLPEQRSASPAVRSRVILEGDPLPPLLGDRFWLAGRVAIPLGYHWFPAVDVATLGTIVGRSQNATEDSQPVWIWHRDEDSIDEIPARDWIAVTRASVRATERELAKIHTEFGREEGSL